MVGELRAVFADLRDDRSVRVVVLAGRGRGFCAGANMTGDDATPPEAQDRGPVGAIHFIQDNLAQLMLAIHELPQPVIAAVHGAAVGGGLAIALAADLRVASDDAFFGAQFIRVGLSSCDVGSSYWLPRVVGSDHRRRAHAHRVAASAPTRQCASACSTASFRATDCSTRRRSWPGSSPTTASTACT